MSESTAIAQELRPEDMPVLPVREGVELRLVDPATTPEVFELIQKNLGRMQPYVAWASEVYTQQDRFEGFYFQLDQYKAGTAYPMTIWVNGKAAGGVDIREMDNPEGAEAGYWIGEEYAGQGLVKQSLGLLIDYARSKHDIKRVRLSIMEENANSIGLAKSMGFELSKITTLTEGPFAGRNEVNYVKMYE